MWEEEDGNRLVVGMRSVSLEEAKRKLIVAMRPQMMITITCNAQLNESIN